jgi:hypothetical protein
MGISRTKAVVRAALLTAAVFGLLPSADRADIIFSIDQGTINPAENLLFDDGTGNPVSGTTNQTGTVIDIYSNETLVANGGQARVEAADGAYDLFFLRPHFSNIVFSEFEANVNIAADSEGIATVTACNQLGNFNGTDFAPTGVTIGDGQPCETFTYDLDKGENFFVLSVADAQLLTGVRITTDVGIVDVRQIRLSPLQSNGENLEPVPEPASLVLFSTGLAFAAKRLRKRNRREAGVA